MEISSFYTCVPQMTITWCMVPEIWSVIDRIFSHFGPFFALFTPLTTQKIKIWEKWKKKHFEISSFNKSVPKIMIICYTVPDIWPMTDVICIFHFGLFFILLPPNSPTNQNLKKKEKKYLVISPLHTCTKNYDHMSMVPEIWCTTDRWTDVWTNGRTDGQTEKVTYRGGSPT